MKRIIIKRILTPFLGKGISGLSTITSNPILPSWVLKSPLLFLYVLDQRAEISKKLHKKSGIYCWYNLENGKYYVGSGVNLRNRINDYFQPSYYKAKADVVIVRAIVKHKMDKFALVILEYTSGHDLIPREQY